MDTGVTPAGVEAARGADPAAGITPYLPDALVPLQPEGTGRPVFVFPAGLNEEKALEKDASIATFVGRDRPFWGLRRDDPHFDRLRAVGLPVVAAESIARIQTVQATGPYLFFGTCIGGYLAWEASRQLLAAGETVAGLLFYEVPIRGDVDTARPRRHSHYYVPQPLPVDVTLLMTELWQGKGWSAAWERVVRGRIETVVIPDPGKSARTDHRERIARHVREWIEASEARLQAR
jgi:thioesterase domain-containing protein